ncbi:flagellar type III secretion system pore protein FliP [Geminicoccus harenae]|uniref:flagellar type III secretion system pore protein FliP n=1 Tax=Geminicoccus harenae TaxID=2498453 RepID=UPI00168B08A9|nr:flagellar type III secretion system pore protein FliP [Geminicoccus harenae]
MKARFVMPILLAAGLLPWAGAPASAAGLTLDLGGGSYTSQLVQIVALITVLSLAPGILVMVTSFTRIVIVLSFLRSALGLQQTPPNPVLIGLALFLTAFVMGPTFQRAYEQGLAPYLAEEIDEATAFERASAPVRAFMLTHTREKDLDLFLNLSGVAPETAEATPLRTLVPAFMISELRRAFEIGFLIFIPFLVIDLLIASVLMSMGMMMLPPVMISLPIKLIFFVLVDGWYLVAGSLVQSFGP